MHMEIINQTLIMSFLGIIASSSIVFPILFLVRRKKQHQEWMNFMQKKNNKDNSELIDKCILTIDEINNKIDLINIKLDGLKKTVKCIRCGTINSNEDNFCSKCGTKL